MNKPAMTEEMALTDLVSIAPLLGDRYQVQVLLGKKTGRRTFLAVDRQTSEPVVVKVMLFGPDFTWDDLKLFEREGQALASLNHDAIPKYLDAFEVNEQFGRGYALVQSYIPAQSLQAWLDSGRTFSEEETIDIALQVLEILEYLHHCYPSIIHRDIKPSNILLGDRTAHSPGKVYLVDFGSIQTLANRDGNTVTIVGSYGYIPLEQFGGQAVPASDLYSLGMTILQVATGIHPADYPFQDENQIKTTLRKPLERWLQRMIHPSRDRRFTDAKQSLERLINLDEQETSLRPPPLGTKVFLERTDNAIAIEFPSLPPFSVRAYIITIVVCFACITLYPILPGLLIIIFGSIFAMLQDLFQMAWLPQTKKLSIHSGYIRYEQVGFFTSPLTAPQSSITSIRYAPSYQFNEYYESSGKRVKGSVRTKPELFIYAGSHDFPIRGLKDFELFWLGQELSDFLKLDLQIIYPTPKVPPANDCVAGGC